jgi:hypothetical protein
MVLPNIPIVPHAVVVDMTPPDTEPFSNNLQLFDLNTTPTTLIDGSS